MRIEALIVGQGLAGTALAWELARRGMSFVIVDPAEPGTCSRVAAGILAPLAGQRLAPSWRLEEALPVARSLYAEVSQRTGRSLFHPMPVMRWLLNPLELERWGKRSSDLAVQPYVEDEAASGSLGTWMMESPHGAVLLREGGYLDTKAYLDASREVFAGWGAWRQGRVGVETVRIETGKACWEDLEARFIVFCQGWTGARCPWFDWVPFNSAKGEILDLVMPGCASSSILSAGKWLLPVGGGLWRAGSTYTHRPLDEVPSGEGRDEILRHLAGILRVTPEVLGHRAAVRPVIRGRQACVGRHPGRSAAAFFNGLRSKGVLLAPFLAKLLADHLWEGRPLPADVDLAGVL